MLYWRRVRAVSFGDAALIDPGVVLPLVAERHRAIKASALLTLRKWPAVAFDRGLLLTPRTPFCRRTGRCDDRPAPWPMCPSRINNAGELFGATADGARPELDALRCAS